MYSIVILVVGEPIEKQIAGFLNAEIVFLEPVVSYSKSYDTVVKQGQVEVNQSYKPKLKSLNVHFEEYEKIIIEYYL